MPAVRTDERRPLADLRDSERKARSYRKAPLRGRRNGRFRSRQGQSYGQPHPDSGRRTEDPPDHRLFFRLRKVRVNWMEGKLALAQHCFYQTGHGMAEGGCEMPVEGVERH